MNEYRTENNWNAFLKEVDTDIILDTVRMELDEDDNHRRNNYDNDHDYNRRHEKDRADI